MFNVDFSECLSCGLYSAVNAGLYCFVRIILRPLETDRYRLAVVVVYFGNGLGMLGLPTCTYIDISKPYSSMLVQLSILNGNF